MLEYQRKLLARLESPAQRSMIALVAGLGWGLACGGWWLVVVLIVSLYERSASVAMLIAPLIIGVVAAVATLCVFDRALGLRD